MDSNEPMTVTEAGRRGGIATRDHYGGSRYFRRIGRKGGKRTAELYGKLLKKFGLKGGRPKRPALTQRMGEEDSQ